MAEVGLRVADEAVLDRMPLAAAVPDALCSWLLATVDRIHGMPVLPEERLTAAEAKLYRLSVADVGTLTGLDFGPLLDADTLQEGEALPIDSLDEVRLLQPLPANGHGKKLRVVRGGAA